MVEDIIYIYSIIHLMSKTVPTRHLPFGGQKIHTQVLPFTHGKGEERELARGQGLGVGEGR